MTWATLIHNVEKLRKESSVRLFGVIKECDESKADLNKAKILLRESRWAARLCGGLSRSLIDHTERSKNDTCRADNLVEDIGFFLEEGEDVH